MFLFISFCYLNDTLLFIRRVQRLAAMQSSFMSFFNTANTGDMNSAYRGRPTWTKYEEEQLVKHAETLVIEVPAARSFL
jgi:hypothetical protein